VIVETSALVAVVLQEPGYRRLLEAMAAAPARGIGTPSLAEAGLVLSSRLGRDAEPLLTRLLEQLDVVPVAFGEQHWAEAVRAFRRFGRGRHPARLNFGDCLSYAVARLADEPLLFVGDDFAQTDLTPA
jgi:ribonuclease VapC